MDIKYADYAVEKAAELIAIDSPSGMTDKAAEWVLRSFSDLGFSAKRTVKGGVTVDLGGKNEDDALLLAIYRSFSGGLQAT